MLESIAPNAVVAASLPRSVSLRRNFALTLTGNVIYAACQWGILICIAKLGTAAMLGQFALALAIAAPVFMMTGLQLRAVLATDSRDEYRFGDYMALRIAAVAVSVIVVVACLAIAGLSRAICGIVLAVVAAKAIESLSDIIYGLWQKHERFEKIAIALAGRGLSSLGAVAAVLYLTGSIVWSVIAMAASWALWLVTYERSGARALLASVSPPENLQPEWRWLSLKNLTKLAWPFGLVMLLLSLTSNIPRYFIQRDLGEAALGYFAAMAYAFVAGNTIVAAIGQSAVPRLSRAFHTDRLAFVRLLRRMVLLAAALGLAGIGLATLFGSSILRVLYRADYANYKPLFVLLMIAAALAYVASIFGYGMTASRAFRPQVPLYAVVAIATTVACLLLIPWLGLMGAAYAVLIGAIVSSGGGAYVVLRALRVDSRRKAMQ